MAACGHAHGSRCSPACVHLAGADSSFFLDCRRCGIFGYYTYGVSKDLQFILETLFNGLKRLEYRGYDSAGIAVELVDAYHPTTTLKTRYSTGSSVDDVPEENGERAPWVTQCPQSRTQPLLSSLSLKQLPPLCLPRR